METTTATAPAARNLRGASAHEETTSAPTWLTVSLVRSGDEQDATLHLQHCRGWRDALSWARSYREDGAYHRSVARKRDNGLTRVEVSR